MPPRKRLKPAAKTKRPTHSTERRGPNWETLKTLINDNNIAYPPPSPHDDINFEDPTIPDTKPRITFGH
jgi:hypothetical protein